jgi:long-chain acyl-CoA synthetase
MIAVPRIFERVFTRIQGQLNRQSGFKRALFNMTTAVGWHRFEYQQHRAGWHPRLLLWPLLRKLVAQKVTAKLGGRLRMAVSGGAALSKPVARIFIGLGVPILQGYGLTETSPVISVNVPDDNEPGSVGVPLNGVDVRIGEHDELVVMTPGMMQGYWNNHAATKEIIDADGWLHTGDQARIENGHIYITGRIKDILVMELAISLVPAIEQVLVIGEGESCLAAVVVLNADEWRELAIRFSLDADAADSLRHEKLHAALLRDIQGHLKDFPGYARIRRLILTLEPWTVDNGLLTPTLKVKRARVLEKFTAEITALYASSPATR